MSDRLYQDLTDICAKHAGVTKPQVDELAEYVAAEVEKARRENTQSILQAYRSSTGIEDDIFTRSLEEVDDER